MKIRCIVYVDGFVYMDTDTGDVGTCVSYSVTRKEIVKLIERISGEQEGNRECV